MPAQRTAEPVVSEDVVRRRATFDGVLTSFGIDPALVDQKIREFARLPLSYVDAGSFATITPTSTPDEAAFAIASWIYSSRLSSYVDRPSSTAPAMGLDGLCRDDATLALAIKEIFRGSYYMEGALMLNGKAESFIRIEGEKYGLTNLRNAALFELWAVQRGASQENIDIVGSLIFKAAWEYGRVVGSRFSRQRDGTYYLTTEDAVGVRRAYEAMAEVPPETAMAATPVRTGAAAQVLTPEQEFERYYSMEGGGLFSNNVNAFFTDDAKQYRRQHRREGTSLTEENLREATVFYLWASTQVVDGNPRFSAEQMNQMGRSRYGGVWDFGVLVGSNLTFSERQDKWVFDTADDVTTVRSRFAGLTVPLVEEARPATVATAPGAPVAAEVGELAQIAARVGVSEEFLRRAIELIGQYGTINVSFNRSDTAEEGMDEGMRGNVPWLRYHPPNGQTSSTNEQLLAAVRDAATSEGIRMRTA